MPNIKYQVENITDEEKEKVINSVKERCKGTLDAVQEIIVTENEDGSLCVDYKENNSKFERIRRITGYITGDLTTWNNAKRAECVERVKHA